MTIAIGEDHKLLCDQDISIHKVPLVPLTPETFKDFGYIVNDFDKSEVEIITWPALGHRPIDPGTGRDGGITEGDFDIFRKANAMYAHNHAVDGHYVTGWFNDPREGEYDGSELDFTSIYTREANYHPDGGQIFFSRNNEPFVLLLALPGDDVKLEDFTAFYCEGSVGAHINAGIWHQPPFPINKQVTFDDKQGKVHACVSCDFVDEFGAYVKVPLNKITA
jgi:ureidoglycolate lyase